MGVPKNKPTVCLSINSSTDKKDSYTKWAQDGDEEKCGYYIGFFKRKRPVSIVNPVTTKSDGLITSYSD